MILAGVVVFLWAGCREENPLGDEGNLAPETYLVQSPRSGQTGFYINHLFWEGYDPDGRVEFFEVAITDSFGLLDDVTWHRTTRTDSLVRFQAGGESGLSQVLGSRFYVRAVDNHGRSDPRPAWIFFGAKDGAAPEVEFTMARGYNPSWPDEGDPAVIDIGSPGTSLFPPDTLPADATVEFRWRGVDRDSIFGQQVGFVTSFEYKLDTVNNTYLGGSISDTSAMYEHLPPGPHNFLVRAVDEAGLSSDAGPDAFELGRRYFQVNYDPWVKLGRAWDSCKGDSVIAFEISESDASQGDPCIGSILQPWDWHDILGDNGVLPVNPCLPMGKLTSGDTLEVGELASLGWWIKLDGRYADPDGDVAEVEINRMICSGDNCAAVPWECASRDTVDDNTIYVGPLTSGDYRIVIAAVDTLDQRGVAGADTIDIQVDRAPWLVHKTEGIPVAGCDCFLGEPGDVFSLCDGDTLYEVATTQLGSDTPCAIETVYADSTSVRSPVTVNTRRSFPLPGEEVELEFFADDEFPEGAASMCCLLWGYDPDGHRNLGYVRWNVDRAVEPIAGWEVITTSRQVIPEGTLTPICFEIGVVGEGEHTLYVEIRDWLSIDYGRRVAERTVKYEIPFTAVDLAKKRYKLPGRDES